MEKVKIIKKANESISTLMLEAESNEEQIKKLKAKADVARGKVKNEMIEEGIDVYIVDNDEENPKFLQALVYQTKKIDYDVDAIKAKLSREQRELVTRSIMIAEESGLRAFIKQHPELRNEIKQFVNKVVMIDEHKLGLALEHGNVTLKDIEGCYEVKENNVFKLQRVKRFELLE